MTGIVASQTSAGFQTQRIFTDPVRFKKCIFYGFSGFNTDASPRNNASGIYLGWSTGQLPITIASGGSYTYEVHDKEQQDISNFYFKANQNDGIFVILY